MSAEPANTPVQGLPDPDTPVLVTRDLRPGADRATLSVFGDDRWNLSPGVFEAHRGTVSLNLTLVPPGYYRETTRRYLWLELNHPDPPRLHRGFARRLSIASIIGFYEDLRAFLTWLSARRVTCLPEVTAAVLDDYLCDVLAAERPAPGKADRLRAVRRLWAFRDLLPPDTRLPSTPPWGTEDAHTLVGCPATPPENRTARIQPATMEPLLLWALRFVDDLACDIAPAFREFSDLAAVPRSRGPRRRPRRTRAELADQVRALVADLAEQGRPLPVIRRADGSTVIWRAGLARLLDTDAGAFHQPGLAALIRAEALPAPAGSHIGGAIVGRLDGRPWRSELLHWEETPRLAQYLMTACLIVVSYLSGMRPGEALNLRRGCATRDATTGLLLVTGTKWKGARGPDGAKLPGGENRDWVVVEPVVRAIAVLERLHDQPLLFPAALSPMLPPRPGAARSYTSVADDIGRFIAWVNRYCGEQGRTDLIPPDTAGDVTASRFRRTLAGYICRRPRGLVAAAIQYGHVHVQLTQGYSGTYASGFPDEFAFESWLHRLDILATAQRRLADGEQVSGPAAQVYRDRVARASAQFAGLTLRSGRQARRMLESPDLQIYPADGMTCVFDSGQALCQTLGDTEQRTPDLTECHSSCRNIARTDRDVAVLRQQAHDIQDRIDDPLAPRPRQTRERDRLHRLERTIGQHVDAARPPRREGDTCPVTETPNDS